MSITDNAELENLKGLEGLEHVEHLRIEHNGIHDTVGLANLSAVGILVMAAYYGLLPQLQRVGQLVLSRNMGLSQNDARNMLERVEYGADQPMVARPAAKRHRAEARS